MNEFTDSFLYVLKLAIPVIIIIGVLWIIFNLEKEN